MTNHASAWCPAHMIAAQHDPCARSHTPMGLTLLLALANTLVRQVAMLLGDRLAFSRGDSLGGAVETPQARRRPNPRCYVCLWCPPLRVQSTFFSDPAAHLASDARGFACVAAGHRDCSRIQCRPSSAHDCQLGGCHRRRLWRARIRRSMCMCLTVTGLLDIGR